MFGVCFTGRFMAKLEKSALKKHLQRSVQILKRSLDYTAYCYFILATLFFYRGDLASLQNGQRIVRVPMLSPASPATMSLGLFQKRKKDLRNELNEAFSSIELIYPPLRGVLLPAVSGDIPDSLLLEYRDHLNDLHQNTALFSSPESFAKAYDYWISQLAGMTVKRGVSYYTQRPLTRLLAGLVRPDETLSIYDPTAGTGGMLLACAEYIRQQDGIVDSTRFYGREKAPDIWAICKMNMLVQNMESAVIEQGDSLQQTLMPPKTFDIVVQNLPLPADPANRGQTRQTNAAFLWHTLDSLSPHGRAAVLSPASLLQQDHREIWYDVLSHDWLEAVISLPPKVLSGTHASASVLVFNKKKPPERQGQVLFIQFPAQLQTRNRHYELQDDDIQAVIQAFTQWGAVGDYARVIPVSRIEEQNYSLSLERYPDLEETSPSFDLAVALRRYRSAVQKREAAVDRLMDNLQGLHDPADFSEDGNFPA